MGGIAEAADALMSLIKFLVVVCVISVPFGMWKIIDLLLLVLHHVHIGVS